MPEDKCRTCGTVLPRMAGRPGRASVYCSAACRQKAYRGRQTAGDTVHELIADIGRQIQVLDPGRPEPFYSEVTALSSSVGGLRRIARVARDAVKVAAGSPDSQEAAENITQDPVTESTGRVVEDDAKAVASVVRSGNEWAFAGLVEPHRREVQAYCYRMVGSYDESEDLVQETLLRAWRKRDGFQGRSTLRAWLYRIATNICLDFLRRNPRRPQRYGPPPVPASDDVEPPPMLAWLQPFPDRLLEETPSNEPAPDAVVVSRETMELVFLTAMQHLPPRQRAVLVLRDVLGWPAADTAAMLKMSVSSWR